MITLLFASRHYKIPYTTLKVAAQRYTRTKGKKGLKAHKPDGSRDWFTTHHAVKKFIDTEYKPRAEAIS